MRGATCIHTRSPYFHTLSVFPLWLPRDSLKQTVVNDEVILYQLGVTQLFPIQSINQNLQDKLTEPYIC